jgi:TolB protein
MKYFLFIAIVLSAIFLTSFTAKNIVVSSQPFNDTVHFPGESHFANVRQLTFGGDNAEAYLSKDGKYLVFQKTDPSKGILCDQIWMGKIPQTASEKFEPKLISTGTGRTTCAYFYPDGKSVLYGSTHLAGIECPPVPDRKKYGNKYIWPIYESMDIFQADLNGKLLNNLLQQKDTMQKQPFLQKEIRWFLPA